MTPCRVLILGYGVLGASFSRLYGSRYEIRGVKRSPLPDNPCPIVLTPIQSEVLCPHVEWADVIIFCPSSGGGNLVRYRETYLGNMAFLLGLIGRHDLPLHALIFIGSTGVYPRSQSKTWHEDEMIPVEADRQEILLRTEQAVVASAVPFTILRSGGLYGKTRGYFYRFIRQGKIYTSEMSDQWILSVHQDDLCGVINRVIARRTIGEIYNVVDDTHLRRRELAQWISQEMDLPIVPDGPAPSVSDRRVSNQKVKEGLGYTFRYPSIIKFLKDQVSLKNNLVP